MTGRTLIDVLFESDTMSDTLPFKKRGGSHTARERGLKGIVVHVTPEDYATLQAAAKAAGVTLKEFCRQAAIEAAKKLG